MEEKKIQQPQQIYPQYAQDEEDVYKRQEMDPTQLDYIINVVKTFFK